MIPENGNDGGAVDLVPGRDLYPVNDAAYRLGITPRKLWMLIEQGRIATKRLDGRRLIPADVLAEFIANLPSGEEPAA